MKKITVFLLLLLVLFGTAGCASRNDSLLPGHSADAVRTFAPSASASATSAPAKKGILQSLPSPSGDKTAYIFTMNATAEQVVYELTILDKSTPFNYEESAVLYASPLLFDIEWGDDTTLMVSLNEKEANDPTPVTSDGVMVMFGRVSTAKP